MEETITFEFIRKVELEEQKSPKPTKLPPNFFEVARLYLLKKEKLTKGRKDELEVRSVRRLIENIFNRRERKIINAAIIAARTGSRPENLTSREKTLFDKLVKIIKEEREKVLGSLKEEKELIKLVAFKSELPAFVGIDGKTYGPFKKGDVARLPEENVRILKEKGVVEEFEVEK